MVNHHPLVTRYQELIEMVRSHNSDTCLIWPYNITPAGYGSLHTPGKGTTRANRYAFKVANGRWPEPEALHKCDNTACINPRHIFEGTTQENTADRCKKGRSAKGERSGVSILTEAMVRQMRAEYVPRKVPTRALARKYGVTQSAVWNVLQFRSWKHVA